VIEQDEGSVVIPAEQLPPNHRSGFVAVVGRPNVGKSTLLNAYLGQKIAIVSPKPQTTRTQILGILTLDQAQIAFVDTPGIHTPRHKFGQYMVTAALDTIPDADVILWLVDISQSPSPEDRVVAKAIQEKGGRAEVLLVLNKADLVAPDELETRAQAFLPLLTPVKRLSISALRGDNRDVLLQRIIEVLPPGPRYFPESQITDLQTRFIAAELVREAALDVLHQEVPHAMAVVVDEFRPRSRSLTYISAKLIVERESQKKIVIGKDGQVLAQIGKMARPQIEELVGTRVYLELWAQVRPKWRRKSKELRRLGYSLPD
jgi:GTPase